MDHPAKVVHYLNQFFGGIGGEEEAYAPVQRKEGPVGPGRALQSALGSQATVVTTLVAGDNFFTEEVDAAKATVSEILEQIKPDVVIAGPAFDAGRYGLACAEVCRVAQARGIPSVTGMHEENPGTLTYRRDVLAVSTGVDSSEMVQVLRKMAHLAVKLVRGEELGPASAEGYLPRGFRRQVVHDKAGYERAVEMLKARLAGQPYVSEMLITSYDLVPAAPPITDLETSTIALVTTGGLVPRGNPDALVRGRAERYFRYPIEGVQAFTIEDWESVHGGFSTVILNTKNPNYAMPVSTVRELEGKGAFKSVYPYLFSTTGNGTAVSAAKRMAAEIAGELKEGEVDGVLLVAT